MQWSYYFCFYLWSDTSVVKPDVTMVQCYMWTTWHQRSYYLSVICRAAPKVTGLWYYVRGVWHKRSYYFSFICWVAPEITGLWYYILYVEYPLQVTVLHCYMWDAWYQKSQGFGIIWYMWSDTEGHSASLLYEGCMVPEVTGIWCYMLYVEWHWRSLCSMAFYRYV